MDDDKRTWFGHVSLSDDKLIDVDERPIGVINDTSAEKRLRRL